MEMFSEGDAYYRLLFDITPLPVLVYDLDDFAILDINQAAVDTYGYSREEFLTLTIGALLTPADFARVQALVAERPVQNREKEIWQHHKKNGDVMDVEISAYTIRLGERWARLVTLNNITQRLQQERFIQAAETYHRLLFEHSPLPAFVFDRTTLEFLDVNETAVRNYGYSRAEFLQMTLKDIRPAEDVPALLKLLVQPARAVKLRETWRHRKKDGSIIEVEINTFPIVYNGHPATVATAQDVTIQRQLTQKLQESERRYRELFEKATDAIYTHDLSGRLTSMNEVGIRLLGYSQEELIGMNITQLLSPDDHDHATEIIRRKLAGEMQNSVYEMLAVTKDGQQWPVELSTTLMYQNDEPVGVQGIARVLTERKRVEEQLRQAQKMEAVGRLAGGIAHDFNNRLTAIQGFTDLLHKRVGPHEQSYYYLEQIKLASERAAELTRQLLTFSRKQVLHPKILNLNEVVSHWGNLVRVLLGENVALHLILGSDIGLVKVDPGQMEHVMMNLALNAGDAMPSGGDFTIETTDLEISELQAKFNPMIPPGQYVRLLIKDNGCGMTEETKSHLFEPFFTTKERGKGTGLGLFTVYGIIKQSGGFIEVKSAPQEGTTFLIYLPVVKLEKENLSAHAAPSTLISGRERILVVEDEPSVRMLVREVLEEVGYNVLEVPQAQDALNVLMRHPDPIDLVLTDVRMPGMDGCDLAERAQNLHSHLRVLFMSAYTDDPRVLEASLGADRAFLQKPFAPDALTQAVRKLLDGVGNKAATTA
ncbi:MAG TPA: PAS domain S-box protein [Blastocatellia bacterium]|nr:PAS domain S-box protein [Blastocatellia bacterium]